MTMISIENYPSVACDLRQAQDFLNGALDNLANEDEYMTIGDREMYSRVRQIEQAIARIFDADTPSAPPADSLDVMTGRA